MEDFNLVKILERSYRKNVIIQVSFLIVVIALFVLMIWLLCTSDSGSTNSSGGSSSLLLWFTIGKNLGTVLP